MPCGEAGYPEAAWAFGTLAAREDRSLNLALLRLDRAGAVVKQNPDLAVARALVLERAGQKSAMVSALAEAASYATSAEQRTWALARMDAARATAKSASTP